MQLPSIDQAFTKVSDANKAKLQRIIDIVTSGKFADVTLKEGREIIKTERLKLEDGQIVKIDDKTTKISRLQIGDLGSTTRTRREGDEELALECDLMNAQEFAIHTAIDKLSRLSKVPNIPVSEEASNLLRSFQKDFTVEVSRNANKKLGEENVRTAKNPIKAVEITGYLQLYTIQDSLVFGDQPITGGLNQRVPLADIATIEEGEVFAVDEKILPEYWATPAEDKASALQPTEPEVVLS